VKFLLDTVTFLLATGDETRVGDEARKYIEDSDEQVYLSSVSAWEIAIKHSMGKLDLPMAPDRLVPLARERLGAEELLLSESSALRVTRLPMIHADPFDRVLVAQAIRTGMTILTPDEAIRQYPVPAIL
jgi:PIN domain nuclease of toxin-antitoxin system